MTNISGNENLIMSDLSNCTILLNINKESKNKERVLFVIVSENTTWIPFNNINDSIENILISEMEKNSHIEFDIIQVGKISNSNDHMALLSFLKTRTILIVDVSYLKKKKNKFDSIVYLLNDYHIGGCIIIGDTNRYSIDKKYESTQLCHLFAYCASEKITEYGLNTTKFFLQGALIPPHFKNALTNILHLLIRSPKVIKDVPSNMLVSPEVSSNLTS